MRSEWSPAEVERLFLGAVDGSLSSDEAEVLARELDLDPALAARFRAYREAIRALREAPREKAPEALASLIVRRTRRRRHVRRPEEGLAFRVPAEVLVALIIAALVALLVFVLAPQAS